MSKRVTVKINFETTLPLIKKVNRSYTVFCEKMGRKPQWVTDWQRGKNLPSPEEAAQMCCILQCEPQDILVNAEDIQKVAALIEAERGKQTIEEKQAELNAYLDELKNDPEQRILFNLAQNATKEQLQATVTFLRMLRGIDKAE